MAVCDRRSAQSAKILRDGRCVVLPPLIGTNVIKASKQQDLGCTGKHWDNVGKKEGQVCLKFSQQIQHGHGFVYLIHHSHYLIKK